MERHRGARGAMQSLLKSLAQKGGSQYGIRVTRELLGLTMLSFMLASDCFASYGGLPMDVAQHDVKDMEENHIFVWRIERMRGCFQWREKRGGRE
jgi:hypothetical protein